ncbi:ABC transporter substrate-binding protein [Pseudomonas indica]|uniref:Glycine betaine/proline transport system substrate-binding protein n=1 Tax=Pseudomonas indica TaxID=137658 RepID=A0A1G8Z4I9_9PSED|nr:ABC transporter substrate-binding protein [Pseudomonas indica]MBU3055265.1 ABC transporter substrate-binding protein [Pseudomonas indica]PAU52853.1 glycine/betaine ABC transporter substrate-binding protein [Pseudomonas indica]SDK09285.1 glycine betaine/proline transport system substrate-binding protein [Pseudomonas indica]
MNRFTHWLLALPFLFAGSLQAAEDARCELVRLSDVGWTDITMTTAVARLVLGEIGYRTQIKRLSLPETYRTLAEGQTDVFLGNWMPAQSELVQPHLDSGRIEKLQTNLPTVRYTLAVLTPGYEAGLHDFADIHKFKEQLNGQIFGIEPGNEGNAMIKGMIRDNTFGLSGFTLVESSESGMLNHVERAQRMGKWAVFLGWEPHPMNERLRMNYLSGGDKFFGPDYGAAQVNTVARGGFSDECPNLARLFRNMTFTIPAENQLMGAVLEGNTNRRRVAKAWIEDNPQTIAAWLDGVTHRQGGPITGIFGLPLGRKD